jgi:phosphatidyl-myo-inositol dimannoside synthase
VAGRASKAESEVVDKPSLDVPRVLVVTNDFPPRVGGVQQYVSNVVRNLPPERVVVLAPNWPGWRDFDAEQPFPIHRWPSTFLWPTGQLFRRVMSAAKEHRAEVVLFGHGFPLAVMGPALSDRGFPYVVMTHGAEVWLARIPAMSAAMRRGFAHARAVTAVSNFTAEAIRPLVPREVGVDVVFPGVDEARFSPDVDGRSVKERHGLEDRKVVLCASRLVPRKGQDVLIQGLELVRELAPEAGLLLVGDGPYRRRLEELAAAAPSGSVTFAGQVPDADLPAYYAGCDVFAMPCRSRWGGLEVEGFGIVFLEAAAAGKAVVAGRSGGAAEAVVDQETGLLVEGREPKAVALAVASLLRAPGVADRMGRAGRRRIEVGLTWAHQTARLAGILRRARASRSEAVGPLEELT